MKISVFLPAKILPKKCPHEIFKIYAGMNLSEFFTATILDWFFPKVLLLWV